MARKSKDMAGKRIKAPSRPYYGELEPGETWPPQKKKPIKKVTKPIKRPSGPTKNAGFGKKQAGQAKSAVQKRREEHRKLLESMD